MDVREEVVIDPQREENPDPPSVETAGSTVPENNLLEEPIEDFLEVDDWVVVQCYVRGSHAKKSRYIGKILAVEYDDTPSTSKVEVIPPTYSIKCLRSKPTKNFSGYVYQYPRIDDIYEYERNEILYKMNEPENLMRGALKFDKHVDEL